MGGEDCFALHIAFRCFAEQKTCQPRFFSNLVLHTGQMAFGFLDAFGRIFLGVLQSITEPSPASSFLATADIKLNFHKRADSLDRIQGPGHRLFRENVLNKV